MTTYIVGVVLFTIDIFIFAVLHSRSVVLKKCEYSRMEVSRLGHNIALVGNKGAGKSTTASGLCHYLTEYLIYELERRMNDIRIKLKNIDFASVEENVDNLIGESNIEEITRTLIKKYANDEWNYFYTNYLDIDLKRKLFTNYIKYYYILNYRKNYVLSKTYLFNRVSLENAILYDSESIELRNVEEKCNFQVDIANIIFDDERAIDKGNVLSSDKKTKLSGATEFNALLRNMYEGLTFKISAKQVSTNEVAQERYLIDSNLEIVDRKDNVASFTVLRAIFKLIFAFYSIPLRLKLHIIALKNKENYQDLYDYFIKSDTNYRKKEHFFYQIDRYLYSLGFIRVRIRNYPKADDVGKLSSKLFEKLVLYFPTYYCYGTINTYDYADIRPYYEQFNDNSIIDPVSKFDEENRIRKFIDTMNANKYD